MLRRVPAAESLAEDPIQWISRSKDAGTNGFRIHFSALTDADHRDQLQEGVAEGY